MFLFSACAAPQRACACEPERQSCTEVCLAPTAAPPLVSESQLPPMPGSKVRGRRLTVPNIFTRFQCSVIYTQLGATQGTLMEQQRTMLQAIVNQFTAEVSHGVVMAVIDGNGRSTEYLCRLDKDMTQMTMIPSDSSASRSFAFHDIERICSPEEVRNLRTSNPFFIDECCTTLVLTGQRLVTLRLDSVSAREYLMLCLQVLRMSQDQARMWYK